MEGLIKREDIEILSDYNDPEVHELFDSDDDEFIERLLSARGIEDTEAFLNPGLENILPYESMYRIEEAKDIVLDGIKNDKKFFVNVDSDTDGVTAGTIMIKWLKENGVDVSYYISQGKSHGTSKGMRDKFEESGAEILIIVDSLDNTVNNYKSLKEELGVSIIILDHHDIEPETPYDDYAVLVSSNRQYDNPQLSGAGVTWKFCMYCDSCLGTYDAEEFADLAACGILADVMDVSNMENRAIINFGFEHLNSPAIKTVIGTYEFNSTSVLYSVAPIINASCRLNENDLALSMFLADDSFEANSYKKRLSAIKTKQNNEVDYIMDGIILDLESQEDQPFILIEIHSENGIAGLIANKIMSQTGKPTLVVRNADGLFMGSGRAPNGYDFRKVCEDTGLCKAMGHPEAFGVEIQKEVLNMFMSSLLNSMGNEDFSKKVLVDAVLDANDVTSDLVSKVKKVNRISGNGFEPLTFLIETDHYEANTMTKGKHLCCDDTCGLKYIKWNAGDFYPDFKDSEIFGDTIGFIGTLDSGFFGRKFNVRLLIEHYFVEE